MEKKEIKAIVFDLDGTLYEDTGHFNYYAKRLKERLEPSWQPHFEIDYQKVLNDEHPLKIGRVYDAEKDLILLYDKRVQTAFKWDGTPLSLKETKRLYPGPVSLNMETMISIGDLWWVPCAIALHYGLDNKEIQEAFLETRNYMKVPEYTIKQVKGLRETLEGLKEKGIKLVLMTNSPEPDSEAILVKLGLDRVFDMKIFNARKPTRAKDQFNEISQVLQLSCSHILSIGDNLANEIIPAREIGYQVLLIDHYNIANQDKTVESVKNCTELVRLLEGIKERD